MPLSLGASAAAAGRVGVKARGSGGAAGSASAGVGNKSVLGLQERMKRLRAAQPKVNPNFTLRTGVGVRQHANVCPAKSSNMYSSFSLHPALLVSCNFSGVHLARHGSIA